MSVRNQAPREERIVVRATWDPDCKVWTAVSDDVPGLVLEAKSLDLLAPDLDAAIPELLALNNVSPKTVGRDLPYHIEAHIDRTIANAV